MSGADPALPAEFSFIARHFRPIAGPGSLGLADDAAVIDLPPGRSLVVCADALVAGMHFLPGDPPGDVAAKLLRVNLSDLAAMGAVPLGYLLTVSTPSDLPDAWFAAFAAGLAADQAGFGLSLLGGDTTLIDGPLCLSLTALGHVAPGRALRRNGARAGDGIWVSGTIGDGALGLLAARGELPDPDGALLRRYRLPEPRLALGIAVAALANAAIDVSDGLVQDLGHLCRESGLSATIRADLVPLSDAARTAGPSHLPLRLTGGDDYELLLAVPPERESAFCEAAVAAGTAVTRIGTFAPGSGVTVLDVASQPLALARGGWSHF